MNDTIVGCKVTGSITFEGKELTEFDPVYLRSRIGMVFQKPNPFPKSIYDNVAYGPRIHGMAKNKAELDDIVERALKKALFGTRSRIGWMLPVRVFRAASNSGFVLPAPWRPSLTFC